MQPKPDNELPLFGDSDCERPSCDDIKKVIPTSMEELQKMAKTHKSKQKIECPPRSQELGRSSWKLLHSMAAWFPDKPSLEQKDKITTFFSVIAEFYPCTWCAKDFQASLKARPVQAESREKLCLWLCEQHNLVNKKLGKPLFPCDMKNLDERWRKSSNEACSSNH